MREPRLKQGRVLALSSGPVGLITFGEFVQIGAFGGAIGPPASLLFVAALERLSFGCSPGTPSANLARNWAESSEQFTEGTVSRDSAKRAMTKAEASRDRWQLSNDHNLDPWRAMVCYCAWSRCNSGSPVPSSRHETRATITSTSLQLELGLP